MLIAEVLMRAFYAATPVSELLFTLHIQTVEPIAYICSFIRTEHII